MTLEDRISPEVDRALLRSMEIHRAVRQRLQDVELKDWWQR
ncbi:MAG: hypothetical protein ACR2JF_08065 [Iamia sp.]